MDDFKDSLVRFDSICIEAWRLRHDARAISSLADAAKAAVMQCIITPNTAVKAYRRTCEDYLARTIAAKGVPVVGVSTNDSSARESTGLYGNGIDFTVAKRELMGRMTQCVDRYRSRAELYFQIEQGELFAFIDEYFRAVPETVKARDRHISKGRAKARELLYWNRLFYTWHALAFPNEVEHYLIALGRPPAQRPIAIRWRYSTLDEDPEVNDVEPHRNRDGRYFLVDDSWAAQQGLVNLCEGNKLSAIDLPGKEIGCMCRVTWITNINELPSELLTDVGRGYLRRRGNQ